MPEFQLHLRTLHPKQELLVNSPKKRKIVRAGRRGGKTVAASDMAVERFIQGQRVLYATPVSDQIEHFWLEVKGILAAPIARRVLKKNETEHSIVVPDTTNQIRGKTAFNPDDLRGDWCNLLILDEWQIMNEDTWNVVCAPMLADTNGDAVFIYTPASLRSRSMSKARDKLHAAKMFQRAQRDPNWLAISWTSYDNPHISREALDQLKTDMSSLSFRQELLAEDIEEVPGALWKRELIDRTRVDQCPVTLKRIIVGVDPSGSTTNEAGVVAVGVGEDDHGYVMADRSLLAAVPKSWAEAAVGLYHGLLADIIVGERNFGGDMVGATIRSVDSQVAYKDTVSSRGKHVRADPIHLLYDQGRMHHVGEFPDLEDEMCSFIPGETGRSPNRMDAMVFAATELFGLPLGLIDYYKKQSETQRAERPAFGPVTRPLLPPVSNEERQAWSRETFDRALRR